MGISTHSIFSVNDDLSPRTLPRTILVCRDQIVQSHNELFADLIESRCNISRQFGAYYIRLVHVARVQQVQRVFWFIELDGLYEYWAR
jgi:hypothetical protein